MRQKYGGVTNFFRSAQPIFAFDETGERSAFAFELICLKLLHIRTRTIAVALTHYCAAAAVAPAFAENTVTSTRRFFSRSSFVF
jgi:hypothetical protein